MYRALKYCLSIVGLMVANIAHARFPKPLSDYHDSHLTSLWETLTHRVNVEPFNAVATLIFLMAIVHTFLSGPIRNWAHALEERYHASGRSKQYAGKSVSFKAQLLHFLGEVEAIFGIWIVFLILAIAYFHGKEAILEYFDHYVEYNEPIFVVIVMAIASTRPILHFAQTCMRQLARLDNLSPRAWWFSILTAGPMLGSFITEPAAMTIAAMLLAYHFYDLEPSMHFKYATLGLLFVNVSIGGTLSHFAAPPILMIATAWDWDFGFMLEQFAWKSSLAVLINTSVIACIFKKEFRALKTKKVRHISTEDTLEIPAWVTAVHLVFLAWTVVCLHHTVLYVGGFLFFLAFMQSTIQYQYTLNLRGPLLVGFFLAGLVTHGNVQQWWIAPILSKLGESASFAMAIVLTSFNDNAAITYLASLVPSFKTAPNLQIALVQGAVAGGGLTVIANAPNPAGQSILAKYFGKKGVSPIQLFIWALLPTMIVCVIFRGLLL